MLLLSHWKKPLLTCCYLTTSTLLHSSRAFVVVNNNNHPNSAFGWTRLHMSSSTTTTSSSTTVNKPLAIVVHAEIDPTRLDEFLPLIHHNAQQSRQEPGCHRFDVLRCDGAADNNNNNNNKFIFYELYASPEDMEYHKQQPHYQAWADFKASGGALTSVTYKSVGESVVI